MTACMRHVLSLQEEFKSEIENAHIDLDGTPTEKVLASSILSAACCTVTSTAQHRWCSTVVLAMRVHQYCLALQNRIACCTPCTCSDCDLAGAARP